MKIHVNVYDIKREKWTTKEQVEIKNSKRRTKKEQKHNPEKHEAYESHRDFMNER